MNLRIAVQVKDLPPDVQVKILKLHHDTFSDSACTTCPGNCCVLCGTHDGYFSGRMPDSDLTKLKDKFGFTKKMGFKGETGCKLPVTERNDICLSFMCSGRAYGDQSEAHPVMVRWGPPKNRPFTDKQRANGFEISNAFWQREDANWSGTPGKSRLKDFWPQT